MTEEEPASEAQPTNDTRIETGPWETPTAVVRWRDDGLLEVRFKDGAHETVAAARQMLEILERAAAPDRRLRIVAVLGQIKNVPLEPREIYASDELARLCSALAIVVQSLVARVLGNVFVTVNRPRTTTRLFADETAASRWLHRGAR